jgi:hypothetical protein
MWIRNLEFRVAFRLYSEKTLSAKLSGEIYMKKLYAAIFCLVAFCLGGIAAEAQTIFSTTPEFRLPQRL